MFFAFVPPHPRSAEPPANLPRTSRGPRPKNRKIQTKKYNDYPCEVAHHIVDQQFLLAVLLMAGLLLARLLLARLLLARLLLAKLLLAMLLLAVLLLAKNEQLNCRVCKDHF